MSGIKLCFRCGFGFGVLLLSSVSPATEVSFRPPPNILFIMADDHAAAAISAYGSHINRTPNLDRLADAGVRFNHCFAVNSICTPSRATILTGKYSHRNGVTVFNRFDGRQWTVAKALRQAGYYTGIVGKWHLFSDPTGFDYWNILPGQGKYHDPDFIEMGTRKTVSGYATDIITDQAIAFLKKRPKNKPFFLMCHHKAPHRPWEPDPRHAQMYDDVEIPMPATFNDDYATRADAAREATMRVGRDLTRNDLKLKPPTGLKGDKLNQWRAGTDAELEVIIKGERKILSGDALKKWKYQQYIKDYLRCVASVDDNVGRLLDYLDQAGLRENTLVIYTSDQGFFLGDHGWFDKRFMYEESIRMPLLMRYPPGIKPGSVREEMVLNLDFAPTFLDFAGAAIPADVQGRSFVPILSETGAKDWRRVWYYRYYHYPGDHQVQPHYGVRTAEFKLIYFNRIDQWELYDLNRDPTETHNLVQDPNHADQLRTLKSDLARLREELDDHDQLQELQQ
jgi:arylsulfatase A-like enzyme